MPHVRGAVLDAFDRAHVTLDDVDGFEVHDCFTPSEYLAIDHIGLTGPGESWKAIENGEIEIGGRAADQPERRADRRRPPGRRLRRPDAARRRQTGQRRRRRLSGRGRKDVRHAELRRQHRHHGQLRRRIGKGVSMMDVEIVGKFLSTLPEDDDHPYRTGPWRPQTTEWDADDLTVVEGEIPRDLDGVYLRNTENPLHPSLKFYHPFDGDGMMHIVGFRDGKAFYRNRFVRTDGLLAEDEAGGPLWPGLAEPRAGRQARPRLGCADADEGRLEHRRHRAPRHRADQLLPVRRPLPASTR